MPTRSTARRVLGTDPDGHQGVATSRAASFIVTRNRYRWGDRSLGVFEHWTPRWRTPLQDQRGVGVLIRQHVSWLATTGTRHTQFVRR